jgi:protein ImuB
VSFVPFVFIRFFVMSFACIYVPEFPVEALLRTSPELREQAVAVLDGTPPLLTIIAANMRAQEVGIQVGMTKLQAEACPQVHLRRRSLDQEAAAHDALLDCAHSFSPRVEDTRKSEPLAVARGAVSKHDGSRCGDTIILDVAGLDRLLGPAAMIARRLISSVTKMGLAANVAIAGNPDAAMHLACGFPGITVVEPGTEAKRLASLPIHLLEHSKESAPFAVANGHRRQLTHPLSRTVLTSIKEMLETLERWGIRDFGSLATLPEVALSQRLGQEGLRLQKLAQGRTKRTLVPAEAAIKFEEAIELEDAIELLEPLAFVLNRMLEQICARLVARALATNELRLTLELTGHEDQSAEEQAASKAVHQRSFQFPVPMQDSRTFLKLLQLDLAAHPPSGPVKKIMIAAEAVPPRFAQSGLFLPRGPAPERLELTLARIRGITGDDRVGSAELLDTHAPGAFRMRPFHPSSNVKSDNRKNLDSSKISRNGLPITTSTMSTPAAEFQRTAMRIFRPPLPTRIQTKQGTPVRVFLRGQPHQVTTAAGPWRKSGGWWTEQSWTRDEWDLELRAEQTTPVLVRVYRDLSSAKWYVEGSFD